MYSRQRHSCMRHTFSMNFKPVGEGHNRRVKERHEGHEPIHSTKKDQLYEETEDPVQKVPPCDCGHHGCPESCPESCECMMHDVMYSREK
jgi:hypothetical protein